MVWKKVINNIVNRNKNNQKKLILVVEYPKSGGTWFISLMADILDLPKRDVYIKNADKHYWQKHYWFEGQENIGITDHCIAKSHELPGSSLHPDNATYIQLIRDGRDVVVSKYFYEKEFLVKNGIAAATNEEFHSFMRRNALEWKQYITAWQEQELVIVCNYENLLSNTERTLIGILEKIDVAVDAEKLKNAVRNNSKEKMREKMGKMYEHNTFIRKGEAGDWNNYFSEYDKTVFKSIAGDMLIKLGYEQDDSW